MSKPTQLYRHYDSDGVLLYVGVSFNTARRLQDHKQCSPWFNLIAKIDVETFPSREEALGAETEAIQSEKPLHNVRKRHTPTLKAREGRRAVTAALDEIPFLRDEDKKLAFKMTTIKPIYSLHELKDFGIGQAMAQDLISQRKLGAIKFPSSARRGYTYKVSGWQLLEFLENLHNEGVLVR